MYAPAHFRLKDREAAYETIVRHPLGLLVVVDGEAVLADPVPFTLDREAGVLRCHVARANPQWEAAGRAGRALVVFQGPEHYVSPSWYPTKRETGKVVPTWNYLHVQVRGPLAVRQDDAWLAAQLEALTRQHEGRRAAPWSVEDAPAGFVAAQRRGIVGLEIAIEDVVAKAKLSQNRTAADRAGVEAGLIEDGAPAMAGLVRRFGRA